MQSIHILKILCNKGQSWQDQPEFYSRMRTKIILRSKKFTRCAIKLERSHIRLVDEKKQDTIIELNDNTKHYYLAC